MSMLKTFAPWIGFTIITDLTDWRLGLAAGLVTVLFTILAKQPRRVGVLDGAMLSLFAVAGVFAFMHPHSGLQDYLGVISMAWLAVVTIGSNLFGHPFTLDFSAPNVPANVASSPQFITVNRTITWAWAAAFAGVAVVELIGNTIDRPVLGVAAGVVVVLGAIRFTEIYAKQSAAAAHQSSTKVPVGAH